MSVVEIPRIAGQGMATLNSLAGDVVLVAGSNVTITPSGQNITIASSGGSAATPALDNLASTAVNADIVPGTHNTISLGSTVKAYNTVYTGVLRARNTGSPGQSLLIDGGAGSVNGDHGGSLNLAAGDGVGPGGTPGNLNLASGGNDATESSGSISITTPDVQSGTATSGAILIRTGATGGAGHSGDITLTFDTGFGNSAGKVRLKDGSEGTANQVWSSNDTTGGGTWAYAAIIPVEANLGTLTWSAGVAPSGTILKTYRVSKVGRQATFLAKITATVAGTAVTAVSFPLPAGAPNPATWGTQESAGLIAPGAGSMAATIGAASAGYAGIYDDGSGGYVVKIFDVAALSATNALCSLTYIY